MSKYAITKASKEGIGWTVWSTIGVPTGFIDQARRDVVMILSNKNLDWMEKLRALETVQSVPMIGKLFYRWFGQPTMTQGEYTLKDGFKTKKYYKDIFTGEIIKKKSTDSSKKSSKLDLSKSSRKT